MQKWSPQWTHKDGHGGTFWVLGGPFGSPVGGSGRKLPVRFETLGIRTVWMVRFETLGIRTGWMVRFETLGVRTVWMVRFETLGIRTVWMVWFETLGIRTVWWFGLRR
jgi:hypothetical protein